MLNAGHVIEMRPFVDRGELGVLVNVNSHEGRRNDDAGEERDQESRFRGEAQAQEPPKDVRVLDSRWTHALGRIDWDRMLLLPRVGRRALHLTPSSLRARR